MKKRFAIKLLLIPKTINKVLFVFFLVAFSSQVVLADDKIVVKNMLKERFDEVITVVENKELNDEAKKDKIEAIIKPIMDFPLMSMLTLGRSSWAAMTKEDRVSFSELLTKLFRHSYLSKILGYAGEDIIFEEPDQKNNKKIDIPAVIVSKDKNVSVKFKFYKRNSSWKVYDVEADGISFKNSYSAQFNDCMQESTIKECMVKLENKLTSQ